MLVAGTYALFGLGLELAVALPLGLAVGEDASGVGVPIGMLVWAGVSGGPEHALTPSSTARPSPSARDATSDRLSAGFVRMVSLQSAACGVAPTCLAVVVLGYLLGVQPGAVLFLLQGSATR
ncbi:hypothetical protein DWQ67_13525 [Galactobacter caseinivorans]|uniref:Uncharacterized protein n=1 Tax=Galactobacter caseinivorans TaxID=2676123 RepID=A0A496PFB1_9MICC|nr:hypothetical protein DWQ67_13525 [Galactobacter caseinivorans]